MMEMGPPLKLFTGPPCAAVIQRLIVNIAAVNATRHILIFINFVGFGASFCIVNKNIAGCCVRKGPVLYKEFVKCGNYEEAKYFFLNFDSPWKKYFSVTSYDHAFCEIEISDMRQ
jgi:hypothetical protein